jgi:hypothetical protein
MKYEVKAAFQKATKEHEARAVERLREQEKRLTDRDQFEAGWRDPYRLACIATNSGRGTNTDRLDIGGAKRRQRGERNH